VSLEQRTWNKSDKLALSIGSMTDMEIGLCGQLRRSFAGLLRTGSAVCLSYFGSWCDLCELCHNTSIFLLLVGASKSVDRLPAAGVCVDV
jgi:hypothetical protein